MAPIQLLTQILPLLVFIIVDSVCNNIRISIVSAIIFAAGQLLFFYLKTGQFDWFVLLDVGLIAGLGVLSIVLKNDMFFKVKPAIIEGMAIIFMLVLFFSSDHFLLNYFGRMMPKGKVLNPAAIGILKTMILMMCGYVLLHIGAVLYTAYYSSRKMWAIVSGPGFYLLFIPVMAWIFIQKIRTRNKMMKKESNPGNVRIGAKGLSK
jgi:intracellular septation protein A